jgi:hypothetical protein
MPISMHAASVPIFLQLLQNMGSWLDKAEAHAKARKFDPNNFVSLRLAPDMLPFSAQIQIATDAAKNCLARLAGVDPPKWPDEETTLPALRARIQKAIDYAQSFRAEQIDGSEQKEITLQMPAGPVRFTGERLLRHFSLPNFLFHATMTYALLRHGGVELGKADFLGAPR